MKSKRLAVLDVGSDALTLIVQDLKTKHPNPFLFRKSRIYPGYGDGMFFDEESVYDALSGLLRECRIRVGMPNSVLVGVPAEFSTVVCKTLSTSFFSRKEITDADIDDLLIKGNTYGSHPDYVTLDSAPIYYLLEGGEQTMIPHKRMSGSLSVCVSYILGARRFVDFFTAMASVLNVEFEFTSSVLAEVQHIIPPEIRDEGTLLLDIGYISSALAYAKGDGIVHMSSFSFGRGHIAGYIWKYADIPFEHAIALTHKLNLNLYPDDNNTYSIAIGNKSFVYKIKMINEIAFYALSLITGTIKGILSPSSNIPSSTPILLTGSGLSETIGAKEFISNETVRRVSIIRPGSVLFDKPAHSSMAALVAEQHKKFTTKKSFFKRLFTQLRRSK
ncbi:MAG: hypothetical protein LBE09_05355 [Christensenellaceae bacterium]|jgi:cell division ATPase FtsA|nr:hypothetical protein [Christensenellaceae bacterium]